MKTIGVMTVAALSLWLIGDRPAGAITLPDNSTCNTTATNGCLRIVNSNATSSANAIKGEASGSGTAVTGTSTTSGIGVKGVSTSGPGVNGVSTSGNGVTATSSSGAGVTAASATGNGVTALATSTSGSGNGVQGTANGDGAGVRGIGTGTNGVSFKSANAAGVYGSSTRGYGVYGAALAADATTGDFFMGGVFGYSNRQFVHGIVGVYQGGDNQMAGVFGKTQPPGSNDPFEYDSSSVGVMGLSGGTGVHGESTSCTNNANCGWAPGVVGRSAFAVGVSGESNGTSGAVDGNGAPDWSTTRALGIKGTTSATSGAFAGVYGWVSGSANDQGAAIVGDAQGSFSTWAGTFIGDIQARGYYNTSDAREKRDIKDAAYGLRELLKLHPVSYKWKRGNDPQEHNGFLAQEVKKVFPAAVHDGATLSVDYSALIPVTVRSIQQLEGTIEKQQAELQRLEARINELEGPKGRFRSSSLTTEGPPVATAGLLLGVWLIGRRRGSRQKES